jgi:spore germination cell wall hydrolase CwlJ-like protein
MPNQIGYQDLAALFARQPSVSAHWREHVLASPFGTIHAATFSFSRPLGTTIPELPSYRLASLNPRDMPVMGRDASPLDAEPQLEFPAVDRRAKGDRLVPPQAESAPVETAALQLPSAPSEPAAAPVQAADVEEAVALRDETPDIPAEDVPDPLEVKGVMTLTPPADESMVEMARLFFDREPLSPSPGGIEKWAPGEEPMLMLPPTAADTDIKLAALNPTQPMAPKPQAKAESETIASKGEVTAAPKRSLSPAERLHLEGTARVKAEKCLANAVYFESRGEAVRGQMAVAQVVMNRVFSGFYPNTVCGVVYQNAHRRLACQFTFACDGIPDVITEPQAWVRAARIAKDTLDGKYWLPEVNRATHYHAYWVRPSWIREMTKLYKFGVHTFYRPRAWGDGSDAPSWGTAEATREAVAKL